MKKFLIFVIVPLFCYACSIGQQPKVKTGIDVLSDNNFDILKNKRVGLVTNPTGVNFQLKSTIDILFEADSVNLVALFSPEHGLRGDHSAGASVSSTTDPYTNLPVYSLFGKTRKPTPEMLAGIDVLVYDIQDIGCRSYTYISTMGLIMEAASENNIEVIILDRPNPIGGFKVEGALVEDGFVSFVSQYKIPYIHGLTVGELARMLNGEKMLQRGVRCKLTVVHMAGWQRNMIWADTGLQWVPSSPHIPHGHSVFFYPMTGILGELDASLIGIGYTLPFQTFVAEWIDAMELTDAMNKLALPGLIFRPITIKPYYGDKKGTSLSGVQIHVTNPQLVEFTALQFRFLEVHHELYPDKDFFSLAPTRLAMFDKVCGSAKVRDLMTKNYKFADLKDYWSKDVERFRKLSSKYYIYK